MTKIHMKSKHKHTRKKHSHMDSAYVHVYKKYVYMYILSSVRYRHTLQIFEIRSVIINNHCLVLVQAEKYLGITCTNKAKKNLRSQ